MDSYDQITARILRANHALKISGIKQPVKILVEVSPEEYDDFYRELRRLQLEWRDFGPKECRPDEITYMGHIIRPVSKDAE